jgi:hypothetical protein
VAFDNDRHQAENVERVTHEYVSEDLYSLFSYAHQWASLLERADGCTLTFSSMLAAMMASEKPLCRWLQRHLGLRGVASKTMTQGKVFRTIELPEPIKTTQSFRTAFAAARRLAGEGKAAEAAEPIDVRHYMAAYAVCPDYHLADFLKLRIDRRAWCLELAERLIQVFPEEKRKWQAYATLATPVPVLAFSTDAPQGPDLLNIDREVEAFSRLIAARTTMTPLSIGVFGAWGSGKSFFMRRVRERVAELGESSRKDGRASLYHERIAQVEFNAWHYSEGSLIACLVDHIFRNLRVGVEDEDDAELRRRAGELIVQIDRAKQELADRERGMEAAQARRLEAQRAVEVIEAKIPRQIGAKRQELEAARTSLAGKEQELAAVERVKQDEIEAAIARAPLHAAVQVFRTGIADSNLSAAENAIGELVREARGVGAQWVPIALGAVAVAITLLAARFAESVMANLVSALTALGTVATACTVWLRKLNALAKRGKEFQDAQNKIAKQAAEAIEAKHEPALEEIRRAIETRREAIAARERELQRLLIEPKAGKDQLEELERQRRIAIERRDAAARHVAERQEALAQISTDSLLGEFLSDRASSEGYRRQLTIFTQVRNDFERLSKLMMRATAEYYDVGKTPPTVSRIVLYIDDLDRCPEDKVIDVLRTVHLLLAFPLFVCVVAADPRWVTACLRKAPGLVNEHGWQMSDGNGAGQLVQPPQDEKSRQLDVAFGKPATPADFLEKIFQIPLWLRPVPSEQRPDIVRALLDPTFEVGSMRFEPPLDPYAKAKPAPAASRTAADEAAAIAEVARAMAPPEPSSPKQVARGASALRSTDSTIDAVELEYLDHLGGLLDGNPRALKRFVNTYRLVKSALSDVELEVFRSHNDVLGKNESRARYLPYRMCMAQLAVLCTQRERALRMVRLADSANKSSNLQDWLDKLGKDDDTLAECFRRALGRDVPDLKQVSFATFALWLERTRRYSFYL